MAYSTAQLLIPITGALFGLALLLMLVALRLFRRSRTHAFWRHRRQAGQRGWQLTVLSFVLLVASALTCGVTGFSLLLDDDNSSVSTTTLAAAQPMPFASPSETPPGETARPASTDQAPLISAANGTATHPAELPSPVTFSVTATNPPPNTVVVVVTATPAATITITTFPTYTPIVTPLSSTVTAFPYAYLRITALDDNISGDLRPLNPRQEFAAGTTRLYLFVEYRSMTAGVVWRRELWRDNTIIEANTYLWGLESTGSSYFFFGDDNGFEPGRYEVRVYIDSATEPASTMTFTVAD